MGTEYVLPAERAPTSEPQSFGRAFPGLWAPGVPQDVQALGLTAEEADALIASLRIPLVRAEAPAPRARATGGSSSRRAG